MKIQGKTEETECSGAEFFLIYMDKCRIGNTVIEYAECIEKMTTSKGHERKSQRHFNY